jgi:hypothetical protein
MLQLRHRLLRPIVLATVLALVFTASSAAGTVVDPLSGTVDNSGATGPISQTYSLNVTDLTVPIQASITWTTTNNGNLNMFLSGPGSSTIISQTSGSTQPKQLSYTPTVTGTYKLRVKASSGAGTYSGTVSYGQGGGGGGAIATYSKTYGFGDTSSMYPYGTAYDPTDHTILVGDYWNFKIRRISSTGALVATYKNSVGAGVGAPYDVEVDPHDTSPCSAGSQNMCADFWVADQEQGDVVEMTHTGQVVQQIGPDGTGSGFHAKGCGGAGGDMTFPTDIVVDPSNGNLFISDVRCKNVWEFTHNGTFIPNTSVTSKWAGGLDWSGWTTDTGYFQPTPRGIQMDENGNIYVLELNSRTIVVFNHSAQYVRSFPRQADMNDPRGLSIDTTRDIIYAVGALKQRLFKFNYAGTMLKEIDASDGTFNIHSDPTHFNSIRFPAVDPATGNVYVGDTWGYRVWGFDSNLAPLPGATFTSNQFPPANGGYTQQTGVALVPTAGAPDLYVAGSFDQRVQEFDTSTDCRSAGNCPAFIKTFGTRVNPAPNATGFDYPKVMQYFDGKLWIGENDGNDIQIYDPSGTWIHRFGLQGPDVGEFKQGVQGMDLENIGGTNYVFATDVGNCRLQVWTEADVLSQTSDLSPYKYMGGCGNNQNGKMSAPRGVVVNGSTAYVVETGDARISEWNWQTQTFITAVKPNCGGTGLNGAWGAVWNPDHTLIYIGDKGGMRVVRFNPADNTCQVVTTGADTPEGSLSGPDFLNFGPDGKLYVSDNNKRVYSFTINS